MKSNYTVLGAMAGSSMDGLDLAIIDFCQEEEKWDYNVKKCDTIPYEQKIYNELLATKIQPQERLDVIDKKFGEWIGTKINEFLGDVSVELLAVHGHTAIHAPEQGISLQLGSGFEIARATGLPTVTDFRSQDVRTGGQGAPLVPFGDFRLFSEYDACLNLGGIANISIRDLRLAWDICPCNQVLNFYAQQLGKDYDHNGELSAQGNLDQTFIEVLETIEYFDLKPPKSLPNGYIPENLLNTIRPEDGLRSYSRFISSQLAKDLSEFSFNHPNLLVTGGGAFNSFLISEIRSVLKDWEVIVPDKTIISSKEAIIFAFLGLMRYLGKINVLSSVTGGSKDTCSGVIHLPK